MDPHTIIHQDSTCNHKFTHAVTEQDNVISGGTKLRSQSITIYCENCGKTKNEIRKDLLQYALRESKSSALNNLE